MQINSRWGMNERVIAQRWTLHLDVVEMKPEKRGEKFLLISLDFPINSLRSNVAQRSFRAHPRQVICYFHSRFPGCARVSFFSASKCLRFSFLEFSARVE